MFKFSIKCFSGACCKINVRLAGDFNAISSLKQFLLQLRLAVHLAGRGQDQPRPQRPREERAAWAAASEGSNDLWDCQKFQVFNALYMDTLYKLRHFII